MMIMPIDIFCPVVIVLEVAQLEIKIKMKAECAPLQNTILLSLLSITLLKTYCHCLWTNASTHKLVVDQAYISVCTYTYTTGISTYVHACIDISLFENQSCRKFFLDVYLPSFAYKFFFFQGIAVVDTSTYVRRYYTVSAREKESTERSYSFSRFLVFGICTVCVCTCADKNTRDLWVSRMYYNYI